MEKIMNSPWFLRIVALGFAALLFTYVNNENSKQINANNRSGGATVNSTEMITDLPVLVDIDQEKYLQYLQKRNQLVQSKVTVIGSSLVFLKVQSKSNASYISG